MSLKVMKNGKACVYCDEQVYGTNIKKVQVPLTKGNFATWQHWRYDEVQSLAHSWCFKTKGSDADLIAEDAVIGEYVDEEENA
jgi:hypothetical protein